MLTNTKNQEMEERVFRHLKLKGEELNREDIEIEQLSAAELSEYAEILDDMKKGNFTRLEDLKYDEN